MIIGLTGYARSGKDTAAQVIWREFGFEPISFARPIKDAVKLMFGLTEAHVDGELKEIPLPWLGGRSPRYLMQTLGTEWGRDLVNQDVWLLTAQRLANSLLAEGLPGVVISDVRFPNEAEWVRNNGTLIRILRPGAEPVYAHSSEAQTFPVDFTIVNDGTREEFEAEVRAKVAGFLPWLQ